MVRAEAAEAKNKQLEQALLERDQDIKSKDHRLDVLEGKFEDASGKLKDSTEKCVCCPGLGVVFGSIDWLMIFVDYGEQTSTPNTQSVNPSDTNRNVINGRRSMRYVRLSSLARDDRYP